MVDTKASTRVVLGVGPKEAEIALVGEAPGKEEELKGLPFVGPAGKVLDRILSKAGLNRYSLYITNVVKTKPPNNDFSIYVKRSGRSISESIDFRAAVEELRLELDSMPNLKVIVAIGAHAMYALTGHIDITKRRGSILYTTLPSGRKVKVVPTIHPAAILRGMPIWEYFAVMDMIKAHRELSEGDLPKRNMRVVGAREACCYMDSIRLQVGFDIEVVGNGLFCFALASSPDDAICVPVHSMNPSDEYETLVRLAKLLEDKNIEKVGHNITFDFSYMYRNYGMVVSPIQDTMIAHAILYPDFPKGLDFVLSHYTREPYYKDEGKIWSRPSVDLERFYIYNAKDAACCLEAFYRLEVDLKKGGFYNTYKSQLSLVEPIVYMQERGIRFDVSGRDKLLEEVSKEIDSLQAELNRLAGKDINVMSPKQLMSYLYIEKGLKPYVSRSTGSITVDGNALKRLSAKGVKEAVIISQIRALRKLKGTYLEMELDNDGRIRGSYNPVGTSSGRLSSSKTVFGTGGNMQNLHPKIKRLCLADEGCLMVQVDLEQAENRVVAYIAPDAGMINAFEKGIDIHRQTAALMFGKSIDEVSDSPGSCSIGDGTKSERFWGKKANHGLNYGETPHGFAFINEIPLKDAQFIVESYYKAYPGVRQYHAWVRDTLAKCGRRLVNCFGRPRVFLGPWGDDLFREAYSYIPQSTVADCMNIRGMKFLYDMGIDILNNEHDSIWFQIPLSKGFQFIEDVIHALKTSLEAPITFRGMTFSIPAEVKIGFNALDMVEVTSEDSVESAYEALMQGLDK